MVKKKLQSKSHSTYFHPLHEPVMGIYGCDGPVELHLKTADASYRTARNPVLPNDNLC